MNCISVKDSGFELELIDIDKSFRNTQVLKSFNASFSAGSITGILGPNGSGKSTLLRIIALIDKSFTGTVLYDGEEVTNNGAGIRKSIGYAPQDAAMYEELSAMDNLKLFSRLSKKHTLQRIDELADAFGMTGFIKKKVHVLSGGMKKRLNLSMALINEPRLLVADEPFAGLDGIQRGKTIEYLKKLSDKGITIIFSSHIDDIFKQLSGKIINLNIRERGMK